MIERRSLRLPITLGVVLIILTLLLTTGWVLIIVFRATEEPQPGLYWALLAIGASCFMLMLLGIITYLVLSIRTINLTRRQSNFIDAVTHELKTPIASLKLLLQTLNSQQLNEAEREEFYRLMMSDANRLDTMINQVLAAARLDQFLDQQNLAPIRFDQLIQQVVAELPITEMESADMKLDLAPAEVVAPESELKIVVNNLLSNAIKYGGSPPKVEVKLMVSKPSRMVLLRVKDNGAGIALNDRRRIFRRFVRLGNELERKKKGTGLGLYLVKTIASRLRGSIRVLKSDSKNGSVFEFRIPGDSPAEPTTPDQLGTEQPATKQEADPHLASGEPADSAT